MNKPFAGFLVGCLLIVVTTSIATVSQTPPQAGSELFIDASPYADAAAAETSVVRQRWVTISLERLSAALPQAGAGGRGGQTLLLNLFPDARFIAILDRVELTATGYVWVGHLQGVDMSTVTLAVTANVISGSIVSPTARYAVRYMGGGVHVLQEINPEALPPEAPPIEILNPGLERADTPTTAADDGSMIDLLVVYTPAARTLQGGVSAIESLIDLGVSETNQAYSDSGVTQRIRLVHKEEIAYTEFGAMGTDLSRLQATSDGFLDTIHAMRNAYGADLVQLIENSPDSCGIAYIMSTVANSFGPFAFGVTHYSCISPNYSFAHEMGHNMGLRHDTFVDTATTPYSYSHGYVNPAALVVGAPASKRWRDIMAYNDQCAAALFNCTRVRYFANPANTYLGDPMGNATTANGAQSLNNTRTTVANFRLEVAKRRHGQMTSE